MNISILSKINSQQTIVQSGRHISMNSHRFGNQEAKSMGEMLPQTSMESIEHDSIVDSIDQAQLSNQI